MEILKAVLVIHCGPTLSPRKQYTILPIMFSNLQKTSEEREARCKLVGDFSDPLETSSSHLCVSVWLTLAWHRMVHVVILK